MDRTDRTAPTRRSARTTPRTDDRPPGLLPRLVPAALLMLLTAGCSPVGQVAPDQRAAPVEPSPTETALTSTTTGDIGTGNAPLTLEFAPVPEGMWRVDSLGTPFEVDVVGDWWVQPNSSGFVVFTAPDSRGPGERDLVLIRPTRLADPTGADGEWPLDDIEGWVDAVGDAISVAPTPTEIGGVEGVTFRIDREGGMPLDFVGRQDVADIPLMQGRQYVVHWLDQGEHEPLVVMTGARDADVEDWMSTAASLLDSVTFGSPAPAPGA